jgi:hypothetical protein
VEEGAVCPYLLDVDVREISGPLNQFQAKKADKISTVEMIQDINKKLTPALDSTTLSKRCDALWPDLEESLGMIPKDPELERAPTRPEPEILEELVGRIRAMDRRFGNLEMQMRSLRSPSPELTPRERRVLRHIAGRSVPETSEEAQLEVVVEIAMDTPQWKQGERIAFRLDEETDFLSMISNTLGLDPASFLKTWFLIAPEIDETLDESDVQTLPEFFRGSPAILRVVDDLLPF